MSAVPAGGPPPASPAAPLDALPAGASTVEDFRRALVGGRAALAARFHAGAPVERLVQDHARLVDALVTRAWDLQAGPSAAACSLVAVGGYGRGELHPASDVDIAILRPDDDAAGWQDAVARFVSFLWDIGLEVGHSVRTVADCEREARADLTVATSLMESRLLAGPAEPHARMI